jgi:predicted kinase
MRKWMSDRLKRSKKKAEDDKANPGPAPLQPAYFEAGNVADAPPADPPPARHRAAPETVAAPDAEDQQPGDEQPPTGNELVPSGGPRPNRRRRGRGGRGRTRTAARPAPAAVATDGNIPEVTAPAAAAVAVPGVAAAPRASKGTVVLAIGLPGSGKSSWFKRHKITALSSDLLRSLLFDDVTEQRFQDLVFSNLRSMLKARLIARRPLNYVDATNLTPHERQSWIKLAKDYGYDVQAVFFDVPLEVCLERNQKRERQVAEDVLRRMSAKLKAPAFEEGFTKITVVRVKKNEEAGS